MSDRDRFVEDLRARLRSPSPGARAAEDCPAPQRILAAVLGQLAPEDFESVAEHGAGCPSCAVAWSLARAYAEETGLGERTEDRSGAGRTWWIRRPVVWVPTAALAAALVGVALLVPWRDEIRAPASDLRAADPQTIESRLAEGEPQPAERFTLRWSAGPEGSRYDVRVTDPRLEHLAGARDLDRPEFTVPPGALAGLEPGSIVLWQVETVLPDGRRIVSRTFATPLE